MKDPALIKAFLSGKYPEKTVKTDEGEFTIKYPSGDENNQIARTASARLNGLPRESFPIMHLLRIDRDATLDVVVTGFPESFPEQFQNNFTNYPYEGVKNALLKAFEKFRKETEDRL